MPLIFSKSIVSPPMSGVVWKLILCFEVCYYSIVNLHTSVDFTEYINNALGSETKPKINAKYYGYDQFRITICGTTKNAAPDDNPIHPCTRASVNCTLEAEVPPRVHEVYFCHTSAKDSFCMLLGSMNPEAQNKFTGTASHLYSKILSNI
jgi:hypothetical protein